MIALLERLACVVACAFVLVSLVAGVNAGIDIRDGWRSAMNGRLTRASLGTPHRTIRLAIRKKH